MILFGYKIAGKSNGGRTGSGRSLEKGYSSGLKAIYIKRQQLKGKGAILTSYNVWPWLDHYKVRRQ